jgi:ApaG protein
MKTYQSSAITKGVMVSVEVFYQKDYSNPMEHEFMFAYRVTIKNGSPHTIQLLCRHWDIFDSNGFNGGAVHSDAGYFELGPQYGQYMGTRILDTPDVFHRYVEGEGVVGMQPVLTPGQEYEYVSGANIKEEIGQMGGYYTFKNTANDVQFKVFIPSFNLITPMKLN